MKRNDFQELARLRLKEAKILLRAGHADGAYYLAGYAIECALKACIARKTDRFEFPEKTRVLASYGHDISILLRTAGLEEIFGELRTPELAANWKVVRRWTVDSRYQKHPRADAEDLIKAVEDRKFGILRWLKHHW